LGLAVRPVLADLVPVLLRLVTMAVLRMGLLVELVKLAVLEGLLVVPLEVLQAL
jgi:hypothetical protein